MSKSRRLQELLKWFPTGTAEGERSILPKVFVYVDEIEAILNPPSGSPNLLVGKKGSGKSAIFDHIISIYERTNVPVLLLVPADINTSDLGETDSTGDMVRKLQGVVLSAVAAKVVEKKSGLLTGDIGLLYEQAVSAGFRTPDGISRFALFLSRAAQPLVKADLPAALAGLSGQTRSGIERAIERTLGSSSFHLLIDDTDQIASPDKVGHLNRIWGLLLAVRQLTGRISCLRATISLRSEVWDRLVSEEAIQRDQTDHFTNLIVRLKSTRKSVGAIVDRRLTEANSALDGSEENWQTFFEKGSARAPDSSENRLWRDLIIVRARFRPRDGIQLIAKLANHAIAEGRDKIEETDLAAVMPSFSKGRADLFAQEVGLECTSALEMLRSFADLDYEGGGFRLSTEQMRDHLLLLPSQFSIRISGQTMRPASLSDAFTLWKFLYLTGVVAARVSDKTQPSEYRHLDPELDTNLVSSTRWNDMQKLLWEVDPAYRDYLISIKNEKANYIGLPMKKRKSRRR